MSSNSRTQKKSWSKHRKLKQRANSVVFGLLQKRLHRKRTQTSSESIALLFSQWRTWATSTACPSAMSTDRTRVWLGSSALSRPSISWPSTTKSTWCFLNMVTTAAKFNLKSRKIYYWQVWSSVSSAKLKSSLYLKVLPWRRKAKKKRKMTRRNKRAEEVTERPKKTKRKPPTSFSS